MSICRSDILDSFSSVDGGLFDHRDASERLEAGSAVRLDSDGVVRLLHRVRQSLRTQRVRLHEPARVSQHLLDNTQTNPQLRHIKSKHTNISTHTYINS